MAERLTICKITLHGYTLTFNPHAAKPWACWPRDNPDNVLRAEDFRTVADRCARPSGD